MRHAFRSLARAPGFTAVALLIIALCLGANLAIFAVLDAVLLRPLPFPDSDRLVTVYNTYPKAGVDRDGASFTNYYERRGKIAAFSSLSIIRPDSAIVGEPGAVQRVETARVSPEFFTTVGILPRIGRAFLEEETTYQTDSVVILTDSFWRQHFNADPAILGRTVHMDGFDRKVVGVLPPDFRFLSSTANLYVPCSSDLSQRTAAQRHSGNAITMVARLKPGVSIAEAQAQIDAHDTSLADSYPQAKLIADAGFHGGVESLHGDHVKSTRPILLLLQAGVLLLLVVGVVNLSNLLLIRASSRAKEVAIRQAMGATARHVVRDVLAETVLLAFAGGLGGLLIAAFGIDLVRTLGADKLPLGATITFDLRIALAALLGSLVLGLLLAGPIAWFNLRFHLVSLLQAESRTSTPSRTAQRLREGFIVTQIALAFVLLSGAGLLGLSLRRAMAVSPGFRPDHILSAQLSLPWKNYHDTALLPFIDRLTSEISQQPGVTAVGVATTLPVNGPAGKAAVTVKGHVVRPGESVRGHYTYGIAGNYFSAMGIALQQGRFITTADSQRPDRVCVVDEDFARRYWPDGHTIGQRVFQGSREQPDANAFTVVGVVAAVKQSELTETDALGAVYFPLSYRADLQLYVVTRTSRAPETFGGTLGEIVRGLDPELQVSELKTMDQRLADSLVARRSPVLLTGIFAGVALLLAAIGTYGVLSYAVAQRQREIGIRMALGAQAKQIGRQFLALGVRLLLLGTGLGFLGAALAGKTMQTILFDVPALHAPTLAVTAIVMIAVAIVACLLPARRATKVDPIIALRAE